VACGGAIGAPARYGIDVLLPTSTHGFPAATYIINVSGALLLGLLYTFVQARYPADRLVRAFFGTGLLGAYTTFSTYMVETALLTRGGYAGLSALYLFGSVIAGLLAAVLGVALGRRIANRS
jgi:CrcB protein